jgi:hypothetical protein
MLNGNIIQNARWGDLQAFFAAGNPPLILVLLAMNTVLIVFLKLRQAKSQSRMRNSTALFVQMALIALNGFVMFHKEALDAAWAARHIL